MKYIFLALSILIGFSMSGQNRIASNLEDYNLERSAEYMIKLYKMDAGQAATFKNILQEKHSKYVNLQGERISVKEFEEKRAIADQAYESSLIDLLRDDQLKIYEVQKRVAEASKGQNNKVRRPEGEPQNR